MHSLRRTIACIGLTAVSSVALAQSYPEKTVRVVVPYSAGGSADILARLVGKALGAHFGQSFVIDNRGSAGGVIAHEMVAKAAPDGYTLLYSAAGPLTVSPHIYRKLSYDPLKTFVPVKLTAFVPLMLVVNPKVPATTVKQLIVEAIASPGKLTYASAGTNTRIIASLARALDNAMAQPEFTAAVASQGGELSRLTTDQFGELIKSEYVKWGKVVKAAGIKNE
ncbi:MAG: tripartite tricarboxylate transporter substrate binding protein [Betaproteobacteria bacterium]|nr:tripartite tricarboxylate transporter substrate binding protein [Betaproteobacteria bacterium]